MKDKYLSKLLTTVEQQAAVGDEVRFNIISDKVIDLFSFELLTSIDIKQFFFVL